MHDSRWLTLRRALGVAGTALLGGAVAWAPVAALTDGMVIVTKAGLAGIALLIIMKVLPRRDAAPSTPSSGTQDARGHGRLPGRKTPSPDP